MAKRRLVLKTSAAVAAVALLATAAVAATGGFDGGAKAGEPLARESMLTPDDLGDGGFDGLQYADPTDGLALIDAPEATSDGSAQLSYPILVPAGRGLTPELSLDYVSATEPSWAGLGWDIGVDAVEVDTSFGVPHFDADKESESYSLDGSMLVPNALGDAWEDRIADRQDFTRQVETEYEQIIRHGDSPKNYWWEVRDKMGGIRWYGAKPDAGGPMGGPVGATTPGPHTGALDPDSIVRDDDDNIVKWLLSAERDVGVNVMRYDYQTLRYRFDTGTDRWVADAACTDDATDSSRVCARHTYLRSIFYTEAADVSDEANSDPDYHEEPPYEIRFIRQTELPDPGSTTGAKYPLRADTTLDATGRYLDLLAERLASIEVWYAGDLEADGDRSGAKLATRYDLGYTTGPFGKTLLTTVTQGGGTPAAVTHTFEYFNEVQKSGAYAGFAADPAPWDTGDTGTADDIGDRAFLDENVSGGALGGSESNSAEGHAYIGFNPAVPQKVGSFGGSIQVGGGRTDGVEELIDLNGDGLPDKVWKDGGRATAASVWYRLNQSGPDGQPRFGEKQALTTLSGKGLSRDNEFQLQVAVESHIVVTASFGVGGAVAWGDVYFTDVNADGLPDLVHEGKVYFNRLEAGVPSFRENSTGTPVELATGGMEPEVQSGELDALQQRLQEASPPIDTVRRWIAPFTGTVSIEGAATLDPPATPDPDDADDSKDGVRVAIQLNEEEASTFAETLAKRGDDAFSSATVLDVAAGDRIYFRVGSIDDGSRDEVAWSPTVTYTEIDGDAVVDEGSVDPVPQGVTAVPLDVNGLSQTVYALADDFTLAGRPNTRVVMPYDGSVRFSATVTKARETSDDLRLVLDLADGSLGTVVPVAIPNAVGTPAGGGADVPIQAGLIPADFVGTIAFQADVAVTGPVQTNPPQTDSLHAHLAVDSSIDLNAVSWNPAIHYTSATDTNGDPVEVQQTINGVVTDTKRVELAPEVEQYPNRAGAEISAPWVADETTDYREVRIEHPFLTSDPTKLPNRDVVLSIKTRDGLEWKRKITLGTGTAQTSVNLADPINGDDLISLVDGEEYWFELSVREPALADVLAPEPFSVELGEDAVVPDDVTPDVALTWTGRQGIYPLAYRGWGVAGYTASGDKATALIDEAAFVVDESSQPPGGPADGFDDLCTGPVSECQPEPDIDPSYAYLPLLNPDSLGADANPLDAPQWRGTRDNLAASADRMRSSRLSSDTVSLGIDEGASADGVTRISVTGPTFSLAFGFGPLGGSVGTGPSWSLVDYEDLNGDGFPDVITPEQVQYTSQRGILQRTVSGPAEREGIVNRDLTVNASGGLDAGLVDIAANNKGKTNTSQGNAASKGSKASDSDPGLGAGFGISIGGGFDLSFTNPNTSGAPGGPLSADYGVPTEASDLPASDANVPISQELADVNGDGLPDVVQTKPSGVFVKYNLGYAFAETALPLATGGFNTQESVGAHASAGFATPWGEFSGGLSFNWNYDMTRFAWIDVNGDGIPDRLHKASAAGQPTVEFGTGSGLAPAVPFGDFAKAAGVGAGNLGNSPQVSYDRSQGIGGGADFTIYAGPLCIAACYLVINPGASYQNSVSFSEVTLEDIDGDGFVDSLSSTDDHEVKVQRNTTGQTNLLSSVANPLGGTISLDYERYGNSVDHPDSTWALSRVAVDDGRPGDGADVAVSTFEYEDPRFDRLFRQSLGFAKVTERELDETNAVARVTESEYLNDNVFVAGLQTSTVVRAGENGSKLRAASLDWGIRDVQGVPNGFDPLAEVDLVDVQTAIPALTGTAALTWSYAPLVVDSEERYFKADGTSVGNETRVSFSYDGLGNVLEQFDEGEVETDADDVRTVTDYSDCRISSSAIELDDQGEYDSGVGCFGDTAYYPMPTDAQASPLFSPDSCPTWVSVPAVVTMYDADGDILRQRDGRDALCDNQSTTYLEERISDSEVAVTELQYDAWGSYNRIVHPEGEGGVRYAVEYVYDAQTGHAHIGEVTEYDFDDPADVAIFLDYEASTTPAPLRTGMTSTATFDWSSGYVKSRTDANGNTTSFGYDDLGRLISISNPLQADVVTFEYHPSAPGYAYAIARHVDRFNNGDPLDTADDDPIETVQFADGIGRITQQKRDARVVDGQGVPADGRVVSAAVVYDVFGHEVQVYRPTFDTVAQTTYETKTSPEATKSVYEFNLLDQETKQTLPDNRVTRTEYGFASTVLDGSSTSVQTARSTDPRGRVTTTFTDIRGNELRMDDQPLNPATPDPNDLLAPKTARYAYNPLGELLRVVDIAGEETTHTYDGLGNKLTTETPDGGLLQTWFDAEGKVIKEVSPTLREEGVETTYHYELQNLVKIDYPQDTPDVTYTYGAAGAAHNGAGRIIRVDDAARVMDLEYDELGNTTSQLSEIKLHNWVPGDPEFQWRTEFTYDALSRMETLTYPDGEVLTYDYDAGGLTTSVVGEEPGLVRVPALDPNGVPMFDADGNPIFTDEDTTWRYDYVTDRRYDEFLVPAAIDYGNGSTTSWTYDPLTRWLENVHTVSANRDLKGNPAEYAEVQDQTYTYDAVGNPKTYANTVPKTVSNLFGNPSSMTYDYDPYDRLTFASGRADVWKNTRTYTFRLGFDDDGNVETKTQEDKLGRKVQTATTYSFTRSFDPLNPHQVSTQGQDTFHYDADGELIQIVNGSGPKAKITREITWNWAGRMELVDEYGQTTRFTYDDAGRRVIERGPSGETAFINPWVTVRNGNELTKQIWVDDELIAQQRDPGDDPYTEEGQRYFLHKDLQGSTNVVTDALGQVFQHQEYFPTGETWINENSTVYRTPYQYAGAYTDEQRKLMDFGERWYDARREMFLTVDPALSDPFNLVEAPELQASYAYAGSNAIRYTDPSGALFTIAKANDIVRAAWDKSDAAKKLDGFAALGVAGSWIDAGKANHLPKSFAKLGAGMDREAAKKWQDTAETFDPNPILDIDLGEGTVKLGAPYGPRKKWGGDKGTTGSTVQSGGSSSGGDATTQGTPSINSNQGSAAGSSSAGAGNSAQAPANPKTKPLPTPPTKSQAKKPLPTPPTKNGTQSSGANGSGS